MTNRVEIVSNDDAEACEGVVCRRLTQPLLMPDNLIDLCSRCGEAVQHRPHLPKRPPRICLECAMPMIEASSKKGELVTVLTPKIAAEVKEHFQKKGAH